jgi:signal transduction histidine kinase
MNAPALLVGLALTIAVAILVPRRWLAASADERSTLAPAVLATTITVGAIIVAIVARLLDVPETFRAFLLAARDVAVLAIPIGFVVGSFQLAEIELRRSRARIIEAADTERRRIERDLHDGAQQRLVGLVLALRVLGSRLGRDLDEQTRHSLDAAAAEARAAIAELRELARGIHPAVLTETGLVGALTALAERALVPTTVTAVPGDRLPQAVEVTAYFVASEALTNVGKHANASLAEIAARVADGALVLTVRDDGTGAVSIGGGTGLRGLADRVTALGGELEIDGRPGTGTTVTATIPIQPNAVKDWG